MAISAVEKISKAKTKLVLSHPFFAIFVLRLEFNENPLCPTMRTNGKEIIYNKKFVEMLSVEEVMGVIVHEVMHIIALHHLPIRRGKREPQRWNYACDFAINPSVVESGFKLPGPPFQPLISDKYKGMNAEKIYNMLPKDIPNSGGGGEGEGKGDGMGGWRIGGVEQPKNADGTALSESQIKELEADIKTTIVEAVQIAKKQGNIPAGFERLIKDLLEPKVNWKSVLQEFVTQNSRNDYSWRFPNKRYIKNGLYLPILEKPELGELVIGIDTSGSLSEKELQEIASEIQAIMNTYEVKLHVIYCDSAVHPPVDEFESGDSVELKMRGGGGTDYRPVFKYIEKHSLDPICLLYFTDGWCDSFPKAPEYKTLWILTEKNTNFKNPFGETTYIRYGKED